jgi:phenylpyruvate tautomerase PptA (4-oxalocrotonate tautomerase family)
MPLINLTLTPGAFDAEAKTRLAEAVTEAALRAESVADLPGPRARGLVLMQELPPGHFFSAGMPADRLIRGVFATWQVSAGVLDAARKAQFARDLQSAAEAASDGDRPVVTSAVIQEVPEGQWAQNGTICRLPEIAAIAQFRHLGEVAKH